MQGTLSLTFAIRNQKFPIQVPAKGPCRVASLRHTGPHLEKEWRPHPLTLWKAIQAHICIQRTLSIFLFFYYLIRDTGCEFRGRIYNLCLPRNLWRENSVISLPLEGLTLQQWEERQWRSEIQTHQG